jgi:hypothetical protein
LPRLDADTLAFHIVEFVSRNHEGEPPPNFALLVGNSSQRREISKINNKNKRRKTETYVLEGRLRDQRGVLVQKLRRVKIAGQWSLRLPKHALGTSVVVGNRSERVIYFQYTSYR